MNSGIRTETMTRVIVVTGCLRAISSKLYSVKIPDAIFCYTNGSLNDYKSEAGLYTIPILIVAEIVYSQSARVIHKMNQ